MKRFIRKVVVIGTGVMGLQISYSVALRGFNVFLKSRSESSLEDGIIKLRESFLRGVIDKKISQKQAEEAYARIKGTTSFHDAGKECDILVESIVEDIDAKRRLFQQLESVCPRYTIFCSNTSSLSITELASSLKTPNRFIGLHFLNPVMAIKLVEIVKGKLTSLETVSIATTFAKGLDKIPMLMNDTPGFHVNRMLIPMINEAIFILDEGNASREDIDLSMKLGAKHPIGPLALADLIGLDVCLAIMESLFTQFRDPKYRPCPLLVKMVQMNWLGRKTKKGFYEY